MTSFVSMRTIFIKEVSIPAINIKLQHLADIFDGLFYVMAYDCLTNILKFWTHIYLLSQWIMCCGLLMVLPYQLYLQTFRKFLTELFEVCMHSGC